MVKFSLTKILSLFAIGYFLFTAWSLYEVFFPADCHSPSPCLKPDWLSTDEFYLTVQTSDSPHSISRELIRTDIFSLSDGIVVVSNMTPPTDVFHNRSATVIVSLSTKSRKIWTGYFPVTVHKQPVRTAFNLLTTQNESASKEKVSLEQPVLFWLTTLRVHILKTPVIFNMYAVPPELTAHIQLAKQNPSPTYNPVLYVNPEMQKAVDWMEVPLPKRLENGTLEYPQLEFTLSVEPQSIGKFRLQCLIGAMAKSLHEYGFRQKEVDDIRQIFVDTNFYFLITTMFISVFHLLFDFLAFKNDISFWKNAKDTTGLSVRTVIWRLLSSFIIFLHLLEERSSLLVTIPMGISACIELWKVTRLFKFSFSFRNGFRIGNRSTEEAETDKIDAQFMFWLQCLVLPLCLAGAVYSLLHTPHRSWYSWCLETLVHGVYAFGFLFMTPQLFINYRLKSVAHLPWKALTYKAFNTFIDDFFAMIITMPISHRIACLRDDAVFIVYLYQRWLYKVDTSRANEFGQRGDDMGQITEPHSTEVVEKSTESFWMQLLPASLRSSKAPRQKSIKAD